MLARLMLTSSYSFFLRFSIGPIDAAGVFEADWANDKPLQMTHIAYTTYGQRVWNFENKQSYSFNTINVHKILHNVLC